MSYRYQVTAVCDATVTERWTVESPTPLSADELKNFDELVATHDGIVVNCTDEDVSDETNREVTSTAVLEDDGERTDCGGCGGSWNVDESDARDPANYCSADCQRRDGSALASRGEG
jgi:hypothetical protein